MQAAEFKPVPFDDRWITAEKIDVHAIYRRPVCSEVDGEQLLNEAGVPRWDLTGGLPVRRHLDWLRKGFEYVTLADAASLKKVAPMLREKGFNPADYVMLRNKLVGASPWHPRLYIATAAARDRQQHDKVREIVEQLGSELALRTFRVADPFYQLPANLRDVQPPAPGVASAAAAGESEADLTVKQLRQGGRAGSRRRRAG